MHGYDDGSVGVCLQEVVHVLDASTSSRTCSRGMLLQWQSSLAGLTRLDGVAESSANQAVYALQLQG